MSFVAKEATAKAAPKEEISQKDAVIPSVAPSESAAVRIMRSEDSVIADLVKEQPTLEQLAQRTITERRVPNVLEFPEEVLERHGKDYHYAWLAKDKNLSTSLRVSGWVLCNRTNSPYIKPSRFATHGALEQAGMLLAFMPKRQADVMYTRPAQMSQAKVKHYTKDIFEQQEKDAPVSFYKPKDDGE